MQPVMILLGSNFIGLLVGGCFFLNAAWKFDLSQMGIYSLAISIQVIVTGFIGNGLSVATVRLATDYIAADDRPAEVRAVAGVDGAVVEHHRLALGDRLPAGLVVRVVRVRVAVTEDVGRERGCPRSA